MRLVIHQPRRGGSGLSGSAGCVLIVVNGGVCGRWGPQVARSALPLSPNTMAEHAGETRGGHDERGDL